MRARRFTVTINGQPAALHAINGPKDKQGILLPTTEEGGVFVGTQLKVSRAIQRTRQVSEQLRRSIVSDFIQAKAPELRPLFGELTFAVNPVEQTKPTTT